MNSENSNLISKYRGQFILTAEEKIVPEGWSCHTYNEWKLFICALPVIHVYDEANNWLGWCIGHPIVDGVLEPDKIVLTKTTSKSTSIYEDFYYRAAGKWALLLVSSYVGKVYLDVYGTLGLVFSTKEKTLASTPTLIGSEDDWDKELMTELNYPNGIQWLPCGITFKKNVKRLLPNHSFDLSEWKETRHWPTKETDLSEIDPKSAIENIVINSKNTIEAITKKYPICLTLTAGMDSRMVLACSRQHIQEAKIVTFAAANETVDMHVASRLTKPLNLSHEFLTIDKANPEELHNWQLLTGLSVSTDIWKIHKTLNKLDEKRVLLPGTSAEMHKGKSWKYSDTIHTQLTALEIAKRYNFHKYPILIRAIEEWLSHLKFINPFHILDLFHAEQRLGCWAAPVSYGNTTSKFELLVFASRVNCENMMRLPFKYRQEKQLVVDICKAEWPELLSVPFNDYSGIKRYLNLQSNKKKIKETIKKVITTLYATE